MSGIGEIRPDVQPKTTWVVVSMACEECGESPFVAILNREPTEVDRQALHAKHHGKFCLVDFKGSVESYPGDSLPLDLFKLERWL